MKISLLNFIFILISFAGFSQEWFTSLDIAQRFALTQNKMILMVWEDVSKEPYPVAVKYDKKTVIIPDLFTDESISPLIWQYFVPVIVSELHYEDMYKAIKGKRKQSYIDKFNDDSIKIMDANGTIVNTTQFVEGLENISNLISNYALNTYFISNQLRNYRYKKEFYSAYYLAEKYIDYAMYSNKRNRQELINVSNIYLNEAISFIETSKEDKNLLKQRTELLKIQSYLVLDRPNKVLRRLKKLQAETITNSNASFMAFLYYTAYKLLDKEEEAQLWKTKVSLVNLKKSQLIITINK